MLLVRHKHFHGILLGYVEYKGTRYYSYANKTNELVNQLKFQVYSKTNDRVSMVLGEETNEPLEDIIHIRRTKKMQWFFDHLEDKVQKQKELDSIPQEVVYEEKDGWLFIYSIKAVKQFKVSEVSNEK